MSDAPRGCKDAPEGEGRQLSFCLSVGALFVAAQQLTDAAHLCLIEASANRLQGLCERERLAGKALSAVPKEVDLGISKEAAHRPPPFRRAKIFTRAQIHRDECSR